LFVDIFEDFFVLIRWMLEAMKLGLESFRNDMEDAAVNSFF
jgi:hypothetical protein